MLGDVADVQLGKMLSAKSRTGHGARPYIRNVNVRWGTIEVEDVLKMDFSEREVHKFELRPRDVLVCEGGEPGRAAVWQDQLPGALYQKALHRVRFREDAVHPGLFAYQLEWSARSGALRRSFTGSTIAHLPLEAMLALPLMIPPRAEQTRIVAAIEERLSDLDAAVAALEGVRARLPRYRAAVLKAACEGRLVPTEAELAAKEARTFEPARSPLLQIEAFNTPNNVDEAALGPAPDGWVWATVAQLAAADPRAITDGPFGSNLKTEHYRPAGPRVIRLQNIGDGSFVNEEAHISPDHFKLLRKHEVRPGDVVIAALGDNPPRSCVIPDHLGPAIVKADCIRVRPDSRLVLGQFMNIVLNAAPTRARVRSRIHGVGRPRLNLAEIKGIELPLPPLLEQRRIVDEVDRHLSVGDALRHAIEAALEQGALLRRAILKQAFAGRLVPQDPNDEPADTLLHRIRRAQVAVPKPARRTRAH